MTVEKFIDCGKVLWLWKIYMTLGKFLDCRKHTFFTSEKIIGLIILKANANTETIMTYILNLEQKLSSFAFFLVEKINIQWKT